MERNVMTDRKRKHMKSVKKEENEKENQDPKSNRKKERGRKGKTNQKDDIQEFQSSNPSFPSSSTSSSSASTLSFDISNSISDSASSSLIKQDMKDSLENHQVNHLTRNIEKGNETKNIENEIITDSNPTSNSLESTLNSSNDDIGKFEKSPSSPSPSPISPSSPSPHSSSSEKLSRPIVSYVLMITEALNSDPNGRMVLGDIYKYIANKWPYFKESAIGWKNSVRHNLSLNRNFHKEERITEDGKVMKTKGTWWRMSTPQETEELLNRERMKEREAMIEGERLSKSNSSSGNMSLHTQHCVKILPVGEKYIPKLKNNIMGNLNGSNINSNIGLNNTLLLPLKSHSHLHSSLGISSFNSSSRLLPSLPPLIKPRLFEGDHGDERDDLNVKATISDMDGSVTLPIISSILSPSLLVNEPTSIGEGGIFSGLPMGGNAQSLIWNNENENNKNNGNENPFSKEEKNSSPMLFWFASPNLLSKMSPRLDSISRNDRQLFKKERQYQQQQLFIPSESSPLGTERMNSQSSNAMEDIRTPPTRYCTI